jgi:hypothetical protein
MHNITYNIVLTAMFWCLYTITIFLAVVELQWNMIACLKWYDIVQSWHYLNTPWMGLVVEWELLVFHSITLLPWLEELSSDTNHLPLTAVGSNSYRGFVFFHVRKLSKLAYWTSRVILRSPFVNEILH